jgi:hypothetical protein
LPASPSSAAAAVRRPTTPKGFIAQVDTLCTRAVAAHASHPFPISDFDPEHPDPAELPVVGEYFARYGFLPETDRQDPIVLPRRAFRLYGTPVTPGRTMDPG